MPTTTQTINPVMSLNQWAGLSDPRRDKSIVPRGEVRFTSIAEDVTIPTAGEDGILQIVCVFPQNFAFVFGELSMKLAVGIGDANTFEDCGQILIVSSLPRTEAGQQTFTEIKSDGNCLALIARGPQKVYSPVAMSAMTYLPDRSGSNVEMHVTIGNATTDFDAGVLDFFARFYMFDVEQAHHFEVNTPSLVRSVT